MTKDELIAKQQLEIEELKEENAGLRADHEKIYYRLYNIGGPLNDNVLNYSKKQLKTFFDISNILGF